VSAKKLLFTTNGETPISGLAKCKKRLAAAMAKELGHDVPQWGLHDIRRTVVSGLQQLGIPVEVAAACINHRSGIATGATSVYAQYDYAAEKRAALEAWDQHVAKLVNPPADKVVPFKQAKKRQA